MASGNPQPPAEDYPGILATVVDAIAIEDITEAGRRLQPIAYPQQDIPARQQLSRALRASIWHRDSYCCRYCGVRTIPDCVMRCIGIVFPNTFPWHMNWRGGRTHPAIPAIASTVDHVVPGSRGGDWLSSENLVTTCPRCNAIKADYTLDQVGWEVRVVSDPEWDGLTRRFRAVWEAAGRPDHQREWLRLLAPDR
ncbi:MAG: HNH endonuclease signature motif containing protein [Actinomycetota bacterium]